MDENGSTFDEVFPDVRKEFEQMGRDKAKLDRVEPEAIRCIEDVAAIAESDLVAMEAIPWDLNEYSEQYRFTLAKIVRRCHDFLNWKTRL